MYKIENLKYSLYFKYNKYTSKITFFKISANDLDEKNNIIDWFILNNDEKKIVKSYNSILKNNTIYKIDFKKPNKQKINFFKLVIDGKKKLTHIDDFYYHESEQKREDELNKYIGYFKTKCHDIDNYDAFINLIKKKLPLFVEKKKLNLLVDYFYFNKSYKELDLDSAFFKLSKSIRYKNSLKWLKKIIETEKDKIINNMNYKKCIMQFLFQNKKLLYYSKLKKWNWIFKDIECFYFNKISSSKNHYHNCNRLFELQYKDAISILKNEKIIVDNYKGEVLFEYGFRNIIPIIKSSYPNFSEFISTLFRNTNKLAVMLKNSQNKELIIYHNLHQIILNMKKFIKTYKKLNHVPAQYFPWHSNRCSIKKTLEMLKENLSSASYIDRKEFIKTFNLYKKVALSLEIKKYFTLTN